MSILPLAQLFSQLFFLASPAHPRHAGQSRRHWHLPLSAGSGGCGEVCAGGLERRAVCVRPVSCDDVIIYRSNRSDSRCRELQQLQCQEIQILHRGGFGGADHQPRYRIAWLVSLDEPQCGVQASSPHVCRRVQCRRVHIIISVVVVVIVIVMDDSIYSMHTYSMHTYSKSARAVR